MKQSAVEYLVNQFRDAIGDSIINVMTDEIKQAKEMEKQQQGYSEEEVLDFLVGILDSTSTFIEFKNIKEWFNKNK